MKLCCIELQEVLKSTHFPLEYRPRFRDFYFSLLKYSNLFDEYFGKSRSTAQAITYCPFCGEKLPESLDDLWFEELEELGFDEPFSDNIPEEYKTDAWWKRKKL